MAAIPDAYARLREQAYQSERADRTDNRIRVQVGAATCELTAGAGRVREEFRKLINASGRQEIELKQVGCTGRCAREPVVGVFVPGQMPVKYAVSYTHLTLPTN